MYLCEDREVLTRFLSGMLSVERIFRRIQICNPLAICYALAMHVFGEFFVEFAWFVMTETRAGSFCRSVQSSGSDAVRFAGQQ